MNKFVEKNDIIIKMQPCTVLSKLPNLGHQRKQQVHNRLWPVPTKLNSCDMVRSRTAEQKTKNRWDEHDFRQINKNKNTLPLGITRLLLAHKRDTSQHSHHSTPLKYPLKYDN